MIDEGGYAVGTKSDLTGGMNSLDKQNVMWGAGIQVADQAGGYAGFFTHMDNKEGAYAKSAPKLISKQLYNRISATDIRRDWWDPSDKESPYVSKKFSFANVASFLGDYIYMRVEEMYFTAAEAALRLDDLKSARELMNTVMAERDPATAPTTAAARCSARRPRPGPDRSSKTSSPTAASNCGVSTAGCSTSAAWARASTAGPTTASPRSAFR